MIIKGRTICDNTAKNGAIVKYFAEDYANELYARYEKDYLPNWKKASEALTNAAEDWRKDCKRGWATLEMKQADEAKYRERVAALEKDLADLRETVKIDSEAVLNEAVARFEHTARITADKMNANAVELLKMGIMKDADYRTMADEYKQNNTMLQVIAKFAEEHAERTNSRELRTFAATLKQTNGFSYREPLERITTAINNAVGTDKAQAWQVVLSSDILPQVRSELADLAVTVPYEGANDD